MKSIIFYARKPNAGFCGPYWTVRPQNSDDKIPVRAEVVEADLVHALDLAMPLEGETVLNTIELP